MDVATFIEQYWYSLVGLPIAIAGTIYVFRPIFSARAAVQVAPRAYFAKNALIALASGALIGGSAVPILDAKLLEGLIIGLVFLGAILMWILMFENSAVRFAGLFSFWGPLRPIPERMAKPVKHSPLLTMLFLVVGLLGGVCVRMLTLAV